MKLIKKIPCRISWTKLWKFRGEGKTIVEESPVQSKGSPGIAERAVQEIEGGLRGMFLALRSRLGGSLDARERIVAIMPEHVAYLRNRPYRGDDGLTACERIKGEKPVVPGSGDWVRGENLF